MNYDIAFRYRRALQPEGLQSIATARDALADAMKDARNAGIDPERDPAVVLLARHLGRIANGEDVTLTRASDGVMRSACMSKIEELRRKPALVALARRGITYDAEAKTAFHREAKSSLRALARELGFGPDDYDLRSNYGGIAVSGEITLHSDQAYIQISLGGWVRVARSCTAVAADARTMAATAIITAISPRRRILPALPRTSREICTCSAWSRDNPNSLTRRISWDGFISAQLT